MQLFIQVKTCPSYLITLITPLSMIHTLHYIRPLTKKCMNLDPLSVDSSWIEMTKYCAQNIEGVY